MGKGVTWGSWLTVEIPLLSVDDFPWFEYIPPKGGNLTPASAVLETWLGIGLGERTELVVC